MKRLCNPGGLVEPIPVLNVELLPLPQPEFRCHQLEENGRDDIPIGGPGFVRSKLAVQQAKAALAEFLGLHVWIHQTYLEDGFTLVGQERGTMHVLRWRLEAFSDP